MRLILDFEVNRHEFVYCATCGGWIPPAYLRISSKLSPCGHRILANLRL